MLTQFAAAAAIAVAAAACATDSSSPSSPSPASTAVASQLFLPSPSATPAGTAASPAFGTRILGKSVSITAPCILDGAQIRADILLWTECDRSTQALTSRIVTYPLPAGPAKVLYEPKVPGTGISLQHISADWVVWSEYTDRFNAKDTKIFALARNGTTPILIDDMTTHGTLVALSDTTLDGADIYWTLSVVENGIWHGRLMRQHLPEGAPAIAVQAPMGSIIGYPSASGGMIAYELTSQTAHPQDQVMLLFSDGHTQRIGTAAASEPALGDGFVAYKAGERFEQGDLAVYRFADAMTLPLGSGEQPFALGPYVTWLPSTPLDDIVRLARPLVGCVDKLSDKPIHGISAPFVGAGSLSWVFRSGDRVEPQVFLAPIAGSATAPCMP